MFLLALTLSALTAAAHSPGQPLQARSGGPACLPHEAPCFRGCIEPDKVQCCSDPAQPDPWTCPLGWECGGGPKFGCWDRRPKTTTTPPPPPIIITVTPTATPPATRAGLISTDLGPVPSGATRKRSSGADEERLATPVEAGDSNTLTGRETCAIDALAATAEQDGASGGTADGSCPRSLVATVAVGVSEAVRGGCWGSAFVIWVAAVVALHGAF
ncbi:hypothetical protein CPLU01_10755 [Colletotrichum plurivorum]|uniref:GPI anchored serine-threonine rich protein n=1 Tax=Colletotrichum plurivorum TaxID=2175906 RepID=A0A8H6K548_9PEZI|nr:hypothetical protein CPLU01_10755 [Colletotrichum plurivorum]